MGSLSNIHFKNKEYKKAYKQLKNNKIETRYILDFCSDLTMNGEYNFVPYDKYGKLIPGLYWYNISFNKKTNQGSYILKFENNVKMTS